MRQQWLITSGICDRRNGVRGQFAGQQSWAPDVRFGSKADIAERETNVRFTPECVAKRGRLRRLGGL